MVGPAEVSKAVALVVLLGSIAADVTPLIPGWVGWALLPFAVLAGWWLRRARRSG